MHASTCFGGRALFWTIGDLLPREARERAGEVFVPHANGTIHVQSGPTPAAAHIAIIEINSVNGLIGSASR